MHALSCIPFIGNVLECLATVGAAFFAYGFGCTLFLILLHIKNKYVKIELPNNHILIFSNFTGTAFLYLLIKMQRSVISFWLLE